MKISIQSLAFTLRREVRDFIQNKVNKLTRLYTGIIGIEVSLKIDRSATKDNKVCTIRLNIPGNDMLSGAQSKSFEAAIARAVEALRNQIERRKTKGVANRVLRKVNYNSPAFTF